MSGSRGISSVMISQRQIAFEVSGEQRQQNRRDLFSHIGAAMREQSKHKKYEDQLWVPQDMQSQIVQRAKKLRDMEKPLYFRHIPSVQSHTPIPKSGFPPNVISQSKIAHAMQREKTQQNEYKKVNGQRTLPLMSIQQDKSVVDLRVQRAKDSQKFTTVGPTKFSQYSKIQTDSTVQKVERLQKSATMGPTKFSERSKIQADSRLQKVEHLQKKATMGHTKFSQNSKALMMSLAKPRFR